MEFSTEFTREMIRMFAAEVEKQIQSEPGVKIGQIETKMRAMLSELGRLSLEEYLSVQEEQYPAAEIGCTCGAKAEYLFGRAAKLLSVFGWVSYRRSYYVCGNCHQGQAPLDQALGLEPGKVSAGLAELLATAGVTTSFEESSQLVKKYLLLEVSENTVRKETQTFGELQTEQERVRIGASQDPEELQERLRTVRKRPKRLYGSLDGAHVPIGKEWRELKSGCWYQVKPVPKSQIQASRREKVGDLSALRAQEITYYCDIETAQEFGKLLWATGVQRAADLAEEIVFVADGAAWIWNLVEYYFPHAVQIVDWYHAEGYLKNIAQLAFGDDQKAAEHWLEQVSSALWEGQVEQVIAACRKFATHPQAASAAQKAVTYYTNNQHRMDYALFRLAGYMIGSGTVESGCKQIVSRRLKLSGARWTLEGARKTAKARAAWLSRQWNQLANLRGSLPLAV